MSAIFSGLASLAGAYLTRRSAKKEAARVAARNRAEAERIQKANAEQAAKAQKQNTQVRQNYYKNVVSDAQAAGVNPLTALRTGGGAGYATAVAGTMASPVMLEGIYEAPTLSRNPLAAGLEAATNTYLSELTRQKQYTHESRMDELNKSLIRAQIKSMTGELVGNDKDEKGRTKINIFGYEMDPADIDDAEKAEERYGDIMSWIYGLGVVGADAYQNLPIITRNAKGMGPMDTTGFEIPFASGIDKSGNRLRLHINNFAN